MDLPNSKEELIALIRPLHANGMLPLAKGFVLILVLAGVVFAAFALMKNSLRARRRRKALETLRQIRERFSREKDFSAFCSDISVLLRRCCLAKMKSKENAAGLKGESWIGFLNETGADLTEEEGTLLADQAFRPASCDVGGNRAELLYAKALAWVELNL